MDQSYPEAIAENIHVVQKLWVNVWECCFLKNPQNYNLNGIHSHVHLCVS